MKNGESRSRLEVTGKVGAVIVSIMGQCGSAIDEAATGEGYESEATKTFGAVLPSFLV